MSLASSSEAGALEHNSAISTTMATLICSSPMALFRWIGVGATGTTSRKRLWINDGAGRFVEVARAVGVTETYDGRAVAFADLWNRGVLDVVVANQNGPLLVYKNTVKPENAWIEFELEGTKSNRSAIGAQVSLYWGKGQQLQEVSGGSGFAAQNQRRLHFGLGQSERVEKAVIRWPSGKVQTIDQPAVRQLHKLKEPA